MTEPKMVLPHPRPWPPSAVPPAPDGLTEAEQVIWRMGYATCRDRESIGRAYLEGYDDGEQWGRAAAKEGR